MRHALPRFRLKPVAVFLALAGLTAGIATAAPQQGNIVAGAAQIATAGNVTEIRQSSDRAIINWRSFNIEPEEAVRFFQPSATSATLNRVTGSQISTLMGRLEANGQIFLLNPNGILIGAGAKIDVGSFVASTSRLDDRDFLEHRLHFQPSGTDGTGIVNAGRITARESGLVALVAPHVRNDGIIEARLGKVVLGAADSYTIDLYGDGLLNLALNDTHRGQLVSPDGRPVEALIRNAGTIATESGSTVLITAGDAAAVLDSLIHVDGAIQARGIAMDGGRIVLRGEDGAVTVSGTLTTTGERGGSIDVLGGTVRLASGAMADASGRLGGGTVRIGGDWQGAGPLPRAMMTTIEAKASIDVGAKELGAGGTAVVWSDGHSDFAGSIGAQGGAAGGNGGRVEVSGKQTLGFYGLVDAGATNGQGGFLLLDPAVMDIGLTEAGLINRVLRLGVNTMVAAELDINVNSPIDGRGRYAGGGLTLSAGRNISLNQNVVTNNGNLNFIAGSGTVNVATGIGAFAGNGSIAVSAGGSIGFSTLDAFSTTGTFTVSSPSMQMSSAGGVRDITWRSVDDLIIGQSLYNFSTLILESTAGDVIVNAPIEGRSRATGIPAGSISLTAAGDIQINQHVVSDNQPLTITAGGTVTQASGKGLFADSGPISVTAGGSFSSGLYGTTGALSLRSTGGSLTIAQGLDGSLGSASLRASQDLTVSQPIVNFLNGSTLAMTTDSGDILINAQIDGRAANGMASGAVTLNAGRHIQLNESIVTEDSALTLNAMTGTVTAAGGKGLFAGSGPISVTTGSDFTTGIFATTGMLTLQSTGGSMTVGAGLDGSLGNVSLRAAQDLNVAQPIVNFLNGSSLGMTTDSGDILINAQIDGRAANGVASGAVTLHAGRHIQINESIVTEDSPLTLATTTGTVSAAADKGLFAGSGAISVTTGASYTSGIYGTTGVLTLRTTGGSLTLGTKIDETVGNVALRGATGVNLDQGIANIRNGASLTVTADTGDININARIDAQDASSGMPALAGGSVTMTAGESVNVNETVVTNNGAISVTATHGSVVFSNAGTDGSGNKKLIAGSAPITVTSGNDFSTGTAPPAGLSFDMGSYPSEPDINLTNAFIAEQLKPWVTLSTSGKLTLISTSGNVSIDAPIPQTTGEIDIRAGNNVIVNEKLVNAQDAPIGVTAGTACNSTTCPNVGTHGMITINNSNSDSNLTVSYLNTTGNTTASAMHGDAAEIDARNADLTLTAYGNVDINEFVATRHTLRITSTAGSIVDGAIGDSRDSYGRPAAAYLSAYQDVGSSVDRFGVGSVGLLDARATNGSVYASLFAPASSFVSAGQDITLSGTLGATATLQAGRNIDVGGIFEARDLNMTAGNDTLTTSMLANRIVINAGNDAIFMPSPSWNTTYAPLWLVGGVGGTALSVTTGRDINFFTPSVATTDAGAWISILGVDSIGNASSSTSHVQPALTLDANRDLTLGKLQTFGAVSLNADRNMVLNYYIGPTILPHGSAGYPDHFSPYDKGVASFSATAGGSLTMVGARATGDITINAGALIATKRIDSTSGSETITVAGAPYVYTPSSDVVDTMTELLSPGAVAPAIIPGPAVNAPAPPAALGALPIGAPGSLSVAGNTAGANASVSSASAPAFDIIDLSSAGDSASMGSTTSSETTLVQSLDNGSTNTTDTMTGPGMASEGSSDEEIALADSSIAQYVDFGRSGSFGPSEAPDDPGRKRNRR